MCAKWVLSIPVISTSLSEHFVAHRTLDDCRSELKPEAIGLCFSTGSLLATLPPAFHWRYRLSSVQKQDHNLLVLCFSLFLMFILSYLSCCRFYPNMTTLRSGLCYRKSVWSPSVVCNVRAFYSQGWNTRKYFFAILYLSHPLTSL